MRHTSYEKIEENYNKYLQDNPDKVLEQIKRQETDQDTFRKDFYEKENKKNYSEKSEGVIILRNSMPILEEKVGEFLKKKEKHKKFVQEFLNLKVNKNGKNYRIIENKDIAFILIKTLLMGMDQQLRFEINKFTTVLTNNIILLMKDNILKKYERPLYDKVMEKRKTKHMGKNLQMIRNTWNLTDLDELNILPVLTYEQKYFIGLKLLDLVLHNIFEKTGKPLFNVKNIFVSKNKKKTYICINESLKDDLKELKDKISYSDTYYNVMVIKPKPWTNFTGGGFLNNDIFQTVDIIDSIDMDNYRKAFLTFKNNSNKKVLKKIIKNSKVDRIFNAVNSLQDTPYVLDKYMFRLIEDMYNNNIYMKDYIPQCREIPLPPKPLDMDTNPDARKQWRREAAQVYDANYASKSIRKVFSLKLDMMRDMDRLEEFYFCYKLDFRGRIYPIQKFITPQSDDLGKSVLSFKKKKKLGKNGLKWLKIHLANLYGYDKESYNNRIEWVDKNIDTIKLIVKDPLLHISLWEKADKPFEFLKTARDYINAINTKNPRLYKSSIAIAIDGSNNGSQHWAAILKDYSTAKSVNLTGSTWNDLPNDVYRDVSDKVAGELSNIVENYLEKLVSGEVLIDIKNFSQQDILFYANEWLYNGYLNRKLCKTPVMTCAYNVSDFGVNEQIASHLKKEGINVPFKSIQFISNLIIKMMNEVLFAVSKGMLFLKEVAGILSKHSINVEWNTPNGLLVKQTYFKNTTRQVDTKLGGARYKGTIFTENIVINSKGSVNGVSANFIHSLDATHMQNVILSMLEKVDDLCFWAIHDSFGVHACDVDTLMEVVRDEFVKLYSVNRLEEFLEHLKKEFPKIEELNDVKLPKLGTFDINECYDSTYIFS